MNRKRWRRLQRKRRREARGAAWVTRSDAKTRAILNVKNASETGRLYFHLTPIRHEAVVEQWVN